MKQSLGPESQLVQQSLQNLPAEPADQQTRHISLVYNPNSCNWLSYRQADDAEAALHQLLEPLLRPAGIAYEIIPLGRWELPQLEKRLHELGSEQIWVAGGDGTILALAPLAKKLDLPLGVIPAGTMNLLARDLGMSFDFAECVRQLLEAEPLLMDMADVNAQPFLCISNLGLSTRFSSLREKLRHQPAVVRWPTIVWQMFSALLHYPNLRIEIEANGQLYKVKSRAISITNNPLCDRGGLFPSRERLDSGQLAIYITQETSAWSMPRLFSKLMLGNWQHDPELQVIHTQEAIFRFPHKHKPHKTKIRQLKVMSDGEIFRLRTPLRYQISARSLRMLRPVQALPAQPIDSEKEV